MPSPNQTKKEMCRIFFNIFELDPKDEDDSIFTSILSRKLSQDGTDAAVLLSYEELGKIKTKVDKKGTSLPSYLLGKIKSL